MSRPLTAKQENFCQLVAQGNTYSDAYRGAYNVGKRTSKNTVYVKSSELMDNGKVAVRIEEIQKETIKRNQATLDEVLNEMANWLRFNLKTLFKENGCMKEIHEMSDDEAACIASFEVTELFGPARKGKPREKIGFLKKVKLIDKRAVSDQFMKSFGAYIAKVKLDDDDLSFLEDIVNGIKE
jgi:phage terminase small subunit